MKLRLCFDWRLDVATRLVMPFVRLAGGQRLSRIEETEVAA